MLEHMGQPKDKADSSPPSTSEGAEAPPGVEVARASVAARLLANQSRLLAFIRHRLGTAAASVRDADDVFATTLRRSDALVRADALLAGLPDSALMALASTISYRAILESSRTAARVERARASAAELARARSEASDAGARVESGEIEGILRERLSDENLAVIVLRLDGLSWSAIAATIGMTPAGAHRRFYRALRALAEAAASAPPRSRTD